MELWHLGLAAVAILFIAKTVMRTVRHPANKLGMQAANLNWVADGREEDDGYRNVRYRKGAVFAVVPFKNPRVLLRFEGSEREFQDFNEAEDWLRSQGLA